MKPRFAAPFELLHPDLIVNSAAYTQVDPAGHEPDLAMMTNARAPGVMAEEALRAHAALIHLFNRLRFLRRHPASISRG